MSEKKSPKNYTIRALAEGAETRTMWSSFQHLLSVGFLHLSALSHYGLVILVTYSRFSSFQKSEKKGQKQIFSLFSA